MPLSNNCVTFVYHKLSCVSFSCCYCFVTMSYTDWFDAIRNHPYTRDMIENVRTFHPTDYLMTPSEMHAALLRHVDTADDKMRQAMLHPKFVSARDWLHASIRNVSCAFPICRSMFYHTQPCFNWPGLYTVAAPECQDSQVISKSVKSLGRSKRLVSLRGPRPSHHARITVHYVVNSCLLYQNVNRDLHFVAHKLICLWAMLMKLMEILASLSQGGSSSVRSFNLAPSGVVPPLSNNLNWNNKIIGKINLKSFCYLGLQKVNGKWILRTHD